MESLTKGLEPKRMPMVKDRFVRGAHRVQHFLAADLAGLHRRKLRAHQAMGLVEQDGTLVCESGTNLYHIIATRV